LLGPRFAHWPEAGRLALAVAVAALGMAVIVSRAPVEAPTRPLRPKLRLRSRRLSLRIGALISLLLLVGALRGAAWTAPVLLAFLGQVLALTSAGQWVADRIAGRPVRG
jgi:hypothetical protein